MSSFYLFFYIDNPQDFRVLNVSAKGSNISHNIDHDNKDVEIKDVEIKVKFEYLFSYTQQYQTYQVPIYTILGIV